MKNLRESGTLQYGLCVDGLYHKDFELRLATLEDVENAIEDAGENACPARIKRFQWAYTLTKLGTLPMDTISPELLAGLEATEYGILNQAQDALRKKLLSASAGHTKTST